jgi:hypothetical protein
MRMAKHSRKDLRIENVPQARYKGEEEEKSEVEDEKNDGDDLEPVSIVRELMEQDRYDSSAHCDDEPAVPDWLSATGLQVIGTEVNVRGSEVPYDSSESMIF